MGLILDLAVIAIAVVVIGSLAALAWTLAVSSVRAVGRGRASVAASRRSITDSEARLLESSARAREAVAGVARRAAAQAAPGRWAPGRPTTRAGDDPDA